MLVDLCLCGWLSSWVYVQKEVDKDMCWLALLYGYLCVPCRTCMCTIQWCTVVGVCRIQCRIGNGVYYIIKYFMYTMRYSR
jgi:hypothetical protein